MFNFLHCWLLCWGSTPPWRVSSGAAPSIFSFIGGEGKLLKAGFSVSKICSGGFHLSNISHGWLFCWGNTPPWRLSSGILASHLPLGEGGKLFQISSGFPLSPFSAGVGVKFITSYWGISVGAIHPLGEYFQGF